MKVQKKMCKAPEWEVISCWNPFFYCCGKSSGRRIFLTQDGLTNQGKKKKQWRWNLRISWGAGELSSRAEPLLGVTRGIKPLFQSVSGATDRICLSWKSIIINKGQAIEFLSIYIVNDTWMWLHDKSRPESSLSSKLFCFALVESRSTAAPPGFGAQTLKIESSPMPQKRYVKLNFCWCCSRQSVSQFGV